MAFISKGSSKAQSPPGLSERDRWIHRDKLTQIEIQEYRDLGLEPPPELLRRAAESRQQAATREQAAALRDIRSPSPYRYDDKDEDDDTYAEEQADPAAESHGHDHGDDDASSVFVPVDPRSPEEIAADPYEDGRVTPLLRKSNSKIPLAPYSPAPVPQEHLDRENRLPRKRGGSEGPEELGSSASIAYPKTRQRKDSTGSFTMLEDDQPLPSSPTSGSLRGVSPNAQRSQASKGTGNKSTSKTRAGANQRSTSSNVRQRENSNTPSRPGTSSGERPRTANAPEGDPPWMANMWKPDPRLPPDQQMLPTHAKRMMQEQMEREGKAAQTYDRDLNALHAFTPEDELAAANARADTRDSLSRTASPTTGDRTAGWPLSADFTGSPRTPEFPKSPGGAHPSPTKSSLAESPIKKSNLPGYSTMPRLTDSPKPQIGLFPSPRIGAEEASSRQPSPRPSSPPKLPNSGLQTRVTGGLEENDEKKKDKKSGGCGCCTVM